MICFYRFNELRLTCLCLEGRAGLLPVFRRKFRPIFRAKTEVQAYFPYLKGSAGHFPYLEGSAGLFPVLRGKCKPIFRS